MATLQADSRLHDIQLIFWGPDKVAELMEKYPNAVGGLVPDLGTRAVAAIVQKADTNWTEVRRHPERPHPGASVANSENKRHRDSWISFDLLHCCPFP